MDNVIHLCQQHYITNKTSFIGLLCLIKPIYKINFKHFFNNTSSYPFQPSELSSDYIEYFRVHFFYSENGLNRTSNKKKSCLN